MPACGNPYMPLQISKYTYPSFVVLSCNFYSSMKSCGSSTIFRRMYSYRAIGVLRHKFLTSIDMNFAPLVEMTLFSSSFTVSVGRQLKVPSIIFLWFDVSSRVLNNIHMWINLLKKSSKLLIRLQPKVHYENRTKAEFGPFINMHLSCLQLLYNLVYLYLCDSAPLTYQTQGTVVGHRTRSVTRRTKCTTIERQYSEISYLH